MRYTGPVRFIFKGDTKTAQRYIGVARSLLGKLISSTTVTSIHRTVSLPNNVRITIWGYSQREISGRRRIAAIDASSARADYRSSRVRYASGLTKLQQEQKDLLETRIATAARGAAASFQVRIDVEEIEEGDQFDISGYLIRLPFDQEVGGEEAPHVILDHLNVTDDSELWAPFVYSDGYRDLVAATTWELDTYGPPRREEPIQTGNVDWRGTGDVRFSWEGHYSRSLGVGTSNKIYRRGGVFAELPDKYGNVQGVCRDEEFEIYVATLDTSPDPSIFYLLRRNGDLPDGWEEIASREIDHPEVPGPLSPYHPVFFNQSGTVGKTLVAGDAYNRFTTAVWGEYTFNTSGPSRGIEVTWGQIKKHDLSQDWIRIDDGDSDSTQEGENSDGSNADGATSGSLSESRSSFSENTTRSQPRNNPPPYETIPVKLTRPVVIDYKEDEEVRLEFKFFSDNHAVVSYSRSLSSSIISNLNWQEIEDSSDRFEMDYQHSYIKTGNQNTSIVFDYRAATVKLPGLGTELFIGSRNFILQNYRKRELSATTNITMTSDGNYIDPDGPGGSGTIQITGSAESSGGTTVNASETGTEENGISPRLIQFHYVDLRDSAYVYVTAEPEADDSYPTHNFTYNISATGSESLSTGANNIQGPTPTYSGESRRPSPVSIIKLTYKHRVGTVDRNSIAPVNIDRPNSNLDIYSFASQVNFTDEPSIRNIGAFQVAKMSGSEGEVSFDDIFFPVPNNPVNGPVPSVERNDTEYTRLAAYMPPSGIKAQYSNHPEMPPLLYYWAPTPTNFSYSSFNTDTPWAEGMYLGEDDVLDSINFDAVLKEHENFIGLFTSSDPGDQDA